jgi:adenylyltransferase/sulfurtransferase
MLTLDEITRYSPQLKLENIGLDGQLKLKKARVLCVGAGGLGSSLLLYLASAGIGTIGIVDDDIVELSNLQRQVLYRKKHLGSKKSIVAIRELTALNPHIDFHTYAEKISSENAKKIIAQYDIVADCSDNFITRYLIHDQCHFLNKPYIYASVSQFEGQCSTFVGNENPCFRCLFPQIPNFIPDCDTAGVLGVLPGLLGIIQATEIIKWILEIGDLLVGRLLIFDILSMKNREFQFTKSPDCNLCASTNTKIGVEMTNHISVKELQQRLQNNEDILLLDVRTPVEHQTYNIGGKLIPLNELPQRLSELDKNQTIVTYCQSGMRSLYATQLLLKENFKSVMNLEGGMVAWRREVTVSL